MGKFLLHPQSKYSNIPIGLTNREPSYEYYFSFDISLSLSLLLSLSKSQSLHISFSFIFFLLNLLNPPIAPLGKKQHSVTEQVNLARKVVLKALASRKHILKEGKNNQQVFEKIHVRYEITETDRVGPRTACLKECLCVQ